MNDISIIIPVYNSRDDLPSCLKSLDEQDPVPQEIILVDNGLVDSSISLVPKDLKNVKVIRNPVNRGYAAACNQGIRASSAPYVVLLNADARLEKGFLAHVIDAFERHPDVGSVTGKIYRFQPPLLDSTGIVLDKRKFSPRDRGENETDHGQYDREECVFGASGAASVYRRSALEDAKVRDEYFDEAFFAYYEDVDLSWRLQLLGWKCLYVPTAIVYHDRKGPEKKKKIIYIRSFANRYLCYAKNELGGCLSGYLPIALPYELGRCVWLFVRKPYMVFSLISFFGRLASALRKRRIIQNKRRVSAEYMSRFE